MRDELAESRKGKETEIESMTNHLEEIKGEAQNVIQGKREIARGIENELSELYQ